MKHQHRTIIAALACLLAASLSGQVEEEVVNFADHISPIIRNNCVDCHYPEGIGPFDLSTFEQIRRRVKQITGVTESRFMPPWKPHPDYGPALIGERGLSDEEINLIKMWQETGMKAGDLSKVPPAPDQTSTWTLGEPDMIVQLPESYLLPAEGIDVYRNFAIPIPLDETKYVQAFELLPETRLAIHHALLMLDDSGRSREREKEEVGVGFDGMGIGSSAPPSGHIVGWTPGQVPYQAYPGTAWELSPGTDLVLQLHLLPSGKPESINPKIGLYFSDEPPDKPSFVLQMRSYDVDIPAGESEYWVEEVMELPVKANVLSVYPHTHYLGKDIQLFAMSPEGQKQWLIRIPDWDFNWQGDYRYKEPVQIPAGSKIHMRYRFDNSEDNLRNPNSPPINVRGGWRSFDEMAEAMIQVIPDRVEDLPKIKEAQKKYDFKKAGGEARFHYFSGIYLEQQREVDRAIQSYLTTIRLDPSFASAYVKLGSIYESAGDLQQAEALYKEALAYQPDLIPAQLGVAKLMMQSQRIRQAGFILKDVYAENPNHLQCNLYLARYFLTRGETEEALSIFKEGEGAFNNSPEFHFEYAQVLLETGNQSGAINELNQALETAPSGTGLESVRTTNKIQAEVHYSLARIHVEHSEYRLADKQLDACLIKSPDHLDALLLSARTAIENQQSAKAVERLVNLVARPEDSTFSTEDILANLPDPIGRQLLERAYLEAGNEAGASRVRSLRPSTNP